jgi:hypothetical protein
MSGVNGGVVHACVDICEAVYMRKAQQVKNLAFASVRAAKTVRWEDCGWSWVHSVGCKSGEAAPLEENFHSKPKRESVEHPPEVRTKTQK